MNKSELIAALEWVKDDIQVFVSDEEGNVYGIEGSRILLFSNRVELTVKRFIKGTTPTAGDKLEKHAPPHWDYCSRCRVIVNRINSFFNHRRMIWVIG